MNFARQHAIPVTAVRPFNNYGPGMKITDGRVIADFFRDALGGRDLVLLSDGSPTRTFCYVSDAITGYYRALLRAARARPTTSAWTAQRSPCSTSRRRSHGLANDHFDYHVKVVRGHSPETDYLVDNPNRRCPDITKARQELQYRPQVTLEEGLRRTLLWYTGNRGGGER